jgi:hypothetical protein
MTNVQSIKYRIFSESDSALDFLTADDEDYGQTSPITTPPSISKGGVHHHRHARLKREKATNNRPRTRRQLSLDRRSSVLKLMDTIDIHKEEDETLFIPSSRGSKSPSSCSKKSDHDSTASTSTRTSFCGCNTSNSTSNSNSTSSTTSNKKNTSHVSFGSVIILEFPLILGDHPSVSSGAPTTIGWNYQAKSEVDVTVYEDVYRPILPRCRRELAMSVPERARILLAAGHTLDDLTAATFHAKLVKTQRAETILHHRQYWDGFNTFIYFSRRVLRSMAADPLK